MNNHKNVGQKIITNKSQNISIIINNRKIRFYLNNDWKWNKSPSVFRLHNKERIEEFANILETLGLEIMKFIHSDIDYDTYIVYCHPMVNRSVLNSLIRKKQHNNIGGGSNRKVKQ